MTTQGAPPAPPCPPQPVACVTLGRQVWWLVSAAADDPDLAAGVAPDGLLAADEAARLAALKIAKRRRDWLLGRATAKALLQAWLAQEIVAPSAANLIIQSETTGVPTPWLADAVGARAPLPVSLSISHCDGHALCALIDRRGAGTTVTLGADMEKVESRAWSFVADYFTPGEVAQVQQATDADRDAVVTAVWSAKEAVLKAVQLGLSVDTRAVDIDLGGRSPSHDWQPLSVGWDARLAQPPDAALTGLWRQWGPYILTLARLDRP